MPVSQRACGKLLAKHRYHVDADWWEYKKEKKKGRIETQAYTRTGRELSARADPGGR
eukprot:SAG22_NODE_16853_length_316_cov_0.898618_1_plen_57_part_00